MYRRKEKRVFSWRWMYWTSCYIALKLKISSFHIRTQKNGSCKEPQNELQSLMVYVLELRVCKNFHYICLTEYSRTSTLDNLHCLKSEKCPNTEFFLVCIFPYLDWIPYSVQMRENTDQKNFVFGQFSSSAWISNKVITAHKGDVYHDWKFRWRLGNLCCFYFNSRDYFIIS